MEWAMVRRLCVLCVKFLNQDVAIRYQHSALSYLMGNKSGLELMGLIEFMQYAMDKQLEQLANRNQQWCFLSSWKDLEGFKRQKNN